jgi:hypothetical protein
MKQTLYREDDAEARKPWTGLGEDLGDGRGRCLFAGEWNADIYDPLKAKVEQGDIHCAKNRMSGMWSPEQPLWKALEKGGLTTVLFAGVNTVRYVLYFLWLFFSLLSFFVSFFFSYGCCA